jgi:Predicted hydrolases or acyltransferases (alpha/beta hydrolase superfamily)
MSAFGEDVRAVTEATGSRSVILIGHSMGGSVIAEAARLMPDRLLGLIGVDTLENIEYPLTQEALGNMIAPIENDFQTGSRQFTSGDVFTQHRPAASRMGFLGYFSCPAGCRPERDERDDVAVHHRRSGRNI